MNNALDAQWLTFTVLDVALFAFLVVTALTIARLRSLFAVAMLTGLFSLLSSALFVLMDAVDVAFTEAAVGAGMTTVLFLATLGLTRSREQSAPKDQRLPALAVATLTGGVLLFAASGLPALGSQATPVQTHPLTERYLKTSAEEIGVPNTVTSVLASYRGFDTLGETAVVFTAGIAVLMLLGRCAREREPGPEE